MVGLQIQWVIGGPSDTHTVPMVFSLQFSILVFIYLLHWVNLIPALALVVFIYLLHWANLIPALAYLTLLFEATCNGKTASYS